MTSTLDSTAPGDLDTTISRVYGSQPFHCDGDLLALGFASDGGLWSVEEPGVLRQWNALAKQQSNWHQLEELATLWCLSGSARLAAAGGDEVSIWETAGGDLRTNWPLPSWVTALAFHPDEQQLVTGHDDGVLRLWDIATQRLVRTMAGHRSPLSAVAFSSDGKLMASAGEDKTIHLWNVMGGEHCGSLHGHTDRIQALNWHPDGRRLVSAGWDSTARVWDVTTREPIILLNSHAGQLLTMAINQDGSILACADSANTVHVWDMSNYRTLWQGADPENPPDSRLSRTCVAANPDGTRLASLGAGTNLRVWESTTAKLLIELKQEGPLRTFGASPDGRWFAASLAGDNAFDANGDPDRTTLGLWDAVTGEKRSVLEGQAAPITALAFSPDSTVLASASSQSGDVWIWNVPTGNPAFLIPDAVDNCVVEALAISPQGCLIAVGGIDWLATSGTDGQVSLWDITKRRHVAGLRGGVTALAFHPNGRRLATATLMQSVRVWDVDTALLVAELTGHLDAVTCVAYSSDGCWLASGSDDRTIRLYQADGGSLHHSIELDSQVKALCFSPDNKYLYTGNANGSCYQVKVGQLSR